MEPKFLSRFFIIFIFLYIGVFFTSILAVKTGFDNYISLTERFWQDPENGREFYYALNIPESQNYLASNNGEVYAGGPIEIVKNAWNAGKNALKQANEYAKCVKENNSLGVTGCFFVNISNVALETSLGCNLTEIREQADSIDLNDQGFVSGLDCSGGISEGLNKFESSANENTAFQPVWGGFLGMAERVGNTIYQDMDSNFSLQRYAYSELNQIPLVGGNIANAYVWQGALKNLTLGEGFFQLWKSSRNLSYYLIIIPTIALGFAIMFRAQINPQTQITLLNIIPRLLIVMALITFSYPLAVLLIKLAEPVADIAIKTIWDSVYSANSNLLGTASNLILIGGGLFIVILGIIINLPTIIVGGGLVFIITLLIFVLAFIIALIRYLIGALILTIKIGLLIAFGPLILLVSAFPGKEPLLKNYILTLISNIFGLSLISILFSLSFALIFLGVITNPAIFFALLVFAIGIVWKSPSAPKMLAGMLGVQPLFSAGQQRR